MSLLEMGYRLIEQVKRLIDRSRRPGWRAFETLAGPVHGVPGLAAPAGLDAEALKSLDAETRAALAGRFTVLGRRWPARSAGEDMWNGALWLTDPASGRPWPGAERFAFDTSYREDPVLGDVKFVWELNRLQFLPPLALRASLPGEDGEAGVILEILQGWMRANPPYRGVNWASGIEAASRVVSLLAAVSFAPALGGERLVRVFLDAHVWWIARYPSRFSSANNHRIAELCALFLAALCTSKSPSAQRQARTRLEREMLRQVYPDGVSAEQSTAYAAYSLEWLALAGLAGEAAGQPFSQACKDRARRALDHLGWLMDDAGEPPRIGDSDQGRVIALTQAPEPGYIASVAAMTARWLKTAEPFAGRRPFALRDLMGAPASGSWRAPLGRRTFALGGLTVWRRARSDGTLLLAFDHGPLGHQSIAAHGHADALAVWLHWGEEAVVVDPGTHLYHARSPTRDLLRGTLAHNTLTLAAQDQSRIVGPFAWANHARTTLIGATDAAVDAAHDGYRRRFGLIHRRRVSIDGDTILIEDRLEGRAKHSLIPFSLGFTLAPQVDARLKGSTADLSTAAGRRLSLDCETTEALPLVWTVARTPYAPAFGVLTSTNRLLLEGVTGASPTIVRTRITLRDC